MGSVSVQVDAYVCEVSLCNPSRLPLISSTDYSVNFLRYNRGTKQRRKKSMAGAIFNQPNSAVTFQSFRVANCGVEPRRLTSAATQMWLGIMENWPRLIGFA
jgi:hypothetical protein